MQKWLDSNNLFDDTQNIEDYSQFFQQNYERKFAYYLPKVLFQYK